MQAGQGFATIFCESGDLLDLEAPALADNIVIFDDSENDEESDKERPQTADEDTD